MTRNFYNADSTFGTDHTKRVKLDVNQVISPTCRSAPAACSRTPTSPAATMSTDDRWGGFVSTKWTPTRHIKITTNYVHTDLSGLPDFGVPYYRPRQHAASPRPASRGAELVRLRQSRLPDRAAGLRHARPARLRSPTDITLTSRPASSTRCWLTSARRRNSPVTTNPDPTK